MDMSMNQITATYYLRQQEEHGCNILDSLESATSAPANDDGDNIWVEQYWREKSLAS